MDIWAKVKDFFRQAEESSSSKPLIHEMIERTEEEKDGYEFWKRRLISKRLLNWISDQYAIFKALPNDTDKAMDFLDTPSSKGFVIHFYKTEYSERDVTYLFDLLKEKILVLEYRTQISDRRQFNRPDWVEKIERHYLKPKPDFLKTEKFNQGFGNITVELLFRNDKPHQLKFQATIYKDHLFKEAETFQNLIKSIVKE
ncbi:MAG: hypothetical protein ACI85O_003215 [Saprospiraceae bacterium]|jgi:hypothetical protein